MHVMRKWEEGTTVAQALRSEMDRREVTFERVAAESGLSNGDLTRYRKDAIPSGERVTKLMNWLGTDLTGIGALIAATQLSKGPRGSE